MTLNKIRATTAAIWVSGIAGTGLLASLTSSSSWLVLAGFAIGPPLIMLRYWNPAPTMSQSIQQVLR